MFTVLQVAERLNVSQATVYALISEKKLSCHRFGVRRGTLRVSAEQLLAFLESTKQEQAKVRRVTKPPPAPVKLTHLSLS